MTVIRPYEPRDRAAVRRIACDTADAGAPVERLGLERGLCADLLMNYYTGHEPETCWVAEVDGRVAGYLAGVLDTNRMERLMRWRVIPAALARALCRGALFHWSLWRLVWRNARLPGVRRRDILPAAAYPAHLHINLDWAARGHGAGAQLMAAFIKCARRAGVPGVHAWVRTDNAAALRFFTKAGFRELGRCPFMRRDARTLLYSACMALNLNAGNSAGR